MTLPGGRGWVGIALKQEKLKVLLGPNRNKLQDDPAGQLHLAAKCEFLCIFLLKGSASTTNNFELVEGSQKKELLEKMSHP